MPQATTGLVYDGDDINDLLIRVDKLDARPR